MQARPVADASAGPAWTMQKAGIGRCVFTAVPNSTSGAVIFENMSTRACRPTRGMPKLNDSLQLQAEFDPRCCLPEIGAILRRAVCRWSRHQPSRTPQRTASSVIGVGTLAGRCLRNSTVLLPTCSEIPLPLLQIAHERIIRRGVESTHCVFAAWLVRPLRVSARPTDQEGWPLARQLLQSPSPQHSLQPVPPRRTELGLGFGLTRFGGHPETLTRGAPDADISTTVFP